MSTVLREVISLSFKIVDTLYMFQVKELAEKARAGKLKPDEFQGGTFRFVD